MDRESADQRGTDSIVVHSEGGAGGTSNYRTQPTAAAKNVDRRKQLLKYLVVAFVVVTMAASIGISVFMFRSGIAAFAIQGRSMEPTFSSGSSVIIRQEDAISRGQLMFFRRPSSWPVGNENVSTLVKRVVAVPGDVLSFDGKSFSVNDSVVYTLAPGETCNGPNNYRNRLSRQQVAVFGDNAAHSMDSRRVFCSGKVANMYVPRMSVVNYGNPITTF